MVKAEVKQRTCIFTGHRDIPEADRSRIARNTREQIIDLISNHGVRYFGVGGAIGFDTLASEVLFDLRKNLFPQIKIILVYPFNGFTSRWSSQQKVRFDQHVQQFDKRVCVSSIPCKEAYLARDRHLVDGAAYCIAYCTKDTGGTSYTVKYAKSKGLVIVNVAEFDNQK